MTKTNPDEAFARFFRAYNQKLVNAVTLWTGDRELAQDIAQEVMETLVTYRYEKPEILMFRMARQRLSRSFIPLQYESLDDETIGVRSRLDRAGADEEIENRLSLNPELMAALRALPTRQREVVVLQIACDMSQEQVAEILGISASAVKTHKTRGLKKLEDAMAKKLSTRSPEAEQAVGGA